MPALLFSFGLAFAFSLVLVPVCGLIGTRLGYVSRPRPDRWHYRPTPLFGGIAIATTVLALSVIQLEWRQLATILTAGTAMFTLGLVDDLVSLRPYSKVVTQIAIASLLAFYGFRLSWSESLTFDAMLTILWVVGVTNAFNLLDNMDGLCAGISLIAGLTLLVTLIARSGMTTEAYYLALVLGATGGFLVYNIHPAKIFMGDSGSLFLGLNLSVLTLTTPAGEHSASNILAIIAGPLLILLVPIFDMSLVTISRVLSGRSAAQGGRDHSSHRLVAIGLSEPRAVTVLWSLSALGGVLGAAIRGFGSEWSSVAAAVFTLGMIIFAVFLAQVRVYDDAEPALLQSGRFTPFALDLMYKRRVAEVLLDVCLVSISYYAAYRLRFEGSEWAGTFPLFLGSLPIIVGVQTVSLYIVGVYRGVWRHFGLMDAVVLSRGVALGTIMSVCIIVFAYRFDSYSRAVFVIYAALLMLLLSGSRASFRLMAEFIRRRRHTGPRLVIYGAGDAGAIAMRELLNAESISFRMLGFIDDDPRKTRVRIQGYPVLGSFEILQVLITAGGVDSVVISTRVIEIGRLNRLKSLCAEHNVTLSRMHFELHELVAVS